jgi:hypothetical protein
MGVINRMYGEAPRFGDGLEELVNFSFKHLSVKCNTIVGSLNVLIEVICSSAMSV